MCRCFGNFLITHYHLGPEKRRQKLINFAKIPKNYVDEVAKKLGKQSKQQLKMQETNPKNRTY